MFGLFKKKPKDDPRAEAAARTLTALLHGMYYVCVADGKIDVAEVDAIHHILGKLGVEAGKDVITGHLDQFKQVDGDDILADLRALAPSIEPNAKELILRAAYLISLSDSDYDEREHAAIDAVSEALAIAEATRTQVRDEIRAMLQGGKA